MNCHLDKVTRSIPRELPSGVSAAANVSALNVSAFTILPQAIHSSHTGGIEGLDFHTREMKNVCT